MTPANPIACEECGGRHGHCAWCSAQGVIKFTGLAEFAQLLPDDQWYELKLRVRKLPDSCAEVYLLNEVENVVTGERLEGIGMANKGKVRRQ